jgi:hypothetical protein
MGKRFQTVAALGFMKILLLLFNTAFWVRLNTIYAVSFKDLDLR